MRFPILVLVAVVLSLMNCSVISRHKTPPRAQAHAAYASGVCSLCHFDTEFRFSGTKHDVRGIGCIDCHGPSEEHVGVEDNSVRPDRHFEMDEVVPFCLSCHEEDVLPTSHEDSHVEFSAEQVCTDCHDIH